MLNFIETFSKLTPKILNVVYQLCGICPISFDTDLQPRQSVAMRRYSIIVAIFLTSFLVSLYFEMENFINIQNSNVGSTVDFIQLVSMRMSSTIIVMEALVTRQHLMNYFQNLCETDQLLADIGIKVNFKAEQSSDLMKITSAIVLYTASESMVLLMYFLRDSMETCRYWISYIPFYIHCCMRYLQLMQFIMMSKRRIDIVNDKLREIDVIRPSSYDRLNYLRDICYKLFVMSTSINRAFGLSTLVNITNDFITVTLHTYFIFVAFQKFTFKSKIKAVESIFWMIPHSINIILLATCCQLTILNANKIGMLLHRIKFNFANEEHSIFMSHFSIQLLLQKIRFNAFGFFSIDFTLLYAIAATVTTYLVILIQFYLAEKNKGTQTDFH